MALPEATERLSHGAPTWFIAGKKTFVTFHNDHHGDGILGFWCAAPPGVQARARRARSPSGSTCPRTSDIAVGSVCASIAAPTGPRSRRSSKTRTARSPAPSTSNLLDARVVAADVQLLRTAWVWVTSATSLSLRVAELGLHDDGRAAGVQRSRSVPRTSPSRTARKKLVDDETVDVDAPGGRLRNAHTAPVVSARVITAPPCIMPAVVHRSGDHGRWPRTSSADAASSTMPTRDRERHRGEHVGELHRAMVVLRCSRVQLHRSVVGSRPA